MSQADRTPLFLTAIAALIVGGLLGFLGARAKYNKPLVDPALPEGHPTTQGPTQGNPDGTAPEGFTMDQHSDSIQQYIDKAAADPSDIKNKIMLGNIFYDGKKWEKALSWYDKALSIQPNNTDVLVDSGVCLKNMHRSQEALERFEHAVKLDPSKPQAHYNRVVVLFFDLGDKEGAQKAMAEAEKAGVDPEFLAPLKKEIEGGNPHP